LSRRYLFILPAYMLLAVLCTDVLADPFEYGSNCSAPLQEDRNQWLSAVNEGSVETGKPEPGIRAVKPRGNKARSLATALAVDLLLPGGGHFLYGRYLLGAGVCALKTSGAYAIFYYYRDWQYRRSLYYAARRANERLDPSHILEFRDPDGGYKTVRDYKHEYDRAAQHVTFAVIANAALYTVSILLTYDHVRRANEDAIPLFEISRESDILNQAGHEIYYIGCTRRL
jgi:hypothetical protein